MPVIVTNAASVFRLCLLWRLALLSPLLPGMAHTPKYITGQAESLRLFFGGNQAQTEDVK